MDAIFVKLGFTGVPAQAERNKALITISPAVLNLTIFVTKKLYAKLNWLSDSVFCLKTVARAVSIANRHALPAYALQNVRPSYYKI